MRLNELFVRTPHLYEGLLRDGPILPADHFKKRVAQRDVDPAYLKNFIVQTITKNKKAIEELPVDSGFVLRDNKGLGIGMSKIERPSGIVYLLQTVHPNMKPRVSQPIFREDEELDKPTPTVGELAEKYHCSLLAVEQQLKKGIKIEMEHTSHYKVAKEIALDHLGEDLYYYKKLSKVEKKNESCKTDCKCPKCNENFADGKGPGRPGDSSRHGIPKGATIAQLEKASKAKGRKGQLARWQLNMRTGKKKGS